MATNSAVSKKVQELREKNLSLQQRVEQTRQVLLDRKRADILLHAMMHIKKPVML